LCRSEFRLDQVPGVLADLGRLEMDLAGALGLKPAGQTIHVFFFRGQKSYRSYLKQFFPGVPYRRALFLKRNGVGMVFAYRSTQLGVDVRHECTHALLHATLPVVPLWLDEGLAEYFEAPPLERAFGSPHLASVRWMARLGIIPKLEKLEAIGNLDGMGPSEYRNAWAWVHFMLHGPAEARQSLWEFLADLEASTPPGYLSARLRWRLPDLKRQFANHFKRWKR